MNPDDRAVVIGIRRYADAPAGWITNLHGPDNDAAAVAEWLTRPDGGGLPRENVSVVRSADLPDPFPQNGVGPHQQAVENTLNDLAELPSTAFAGQYAGRRLYVYVSGRGYAHASDDAALVTAEAKKDRPVNVHVSSWVDWFCSAARFQEVVLWVDTCASSAPPEVFTRCNRIPRISPNASSVRRFTAFAAGINKRAVEAEMPDDAWHGAFTYALLQGLNGAAASPVRTNSLRDYLINNMATFMRDEQKQDSMVGREPAFGTTDDILFAAPPRPKFAVTLRFDQACVGKRVTVNTRQSDPATAETLLHQTEWTPELEAGAYGVFVEDLGLSKAFLVSGGGTDDVVTIP